ncbi:TetR family transcriptional regulator [Saccharomonospora sp. NPDC006951]
MPRIGEVRAPAEPNSPTQQARFRRILRAAGRLGGEYELDHVQMQEVAKEAGVAIATLYRYFPSKTELFTAVMGDQLDRLAEDTPTTLSTSDSGEASREAVVALLVEAGRRLLARPLLARAMIQSNNAAHAGTSAEADRNDEKLRRIVLRALGIGEPASEDVRIVRLLVHCWHGSLMRCLNGRMEPSEMESDVRVACRMLLPSGRDSSR